MFEMGRQRGVNRPQILLQPFTHGLADRSAGLAIDLFSDVGGSAVHDEFRFKCATPDQVIGARIVSRFALIAWLLVKNK
jgi:hypothetical protein